MTDNKDLKYIQQFKKEPNVPKTYEQFILEEQQLTSEQQRELYPDLEHGDIRERGGYGPTDKGSSEPTEEEKRYDIKTTASQAIGATGEYAIPIGAVLHDAGKVGEFLTEASGPAVSESAKKNWKAVSDVGRDAVIEGALGGVAGGMAGKLAGEGAQEATEAVLGTAPSMYEKTAHEAHKA